jgi:hypothetical protein
MRLGIMHGRPKTEEQLLRLIYWEIQSRISSKGKFTKIRENVALCLNWNIAFFYCAWFKCCVVLLVVSFGCSVLFVLVLLETFRL